MASQAIKYQTTTVDAVKSAGEIQTLVQRYGASRCELRFGETGQVVGIRFAIRHPKFDEVPVRLQAKTQRIFEILQGTRKYGSDRRRKEADDRAQAYRIAWRQLKDLTEQLLLATKTGLFELHEAFMAGVEAEDPETGETVTFAELLTRHGSTGPGGMKLLNPAPIVEAEVVEVIDG